MCVCVCVCVCMRLHVFIFLDFETGRLGRVERLIGLAMEKPEQNLSSFAAQKWLHFRLVVRADPVLGSSIQKKTYICFCLLKCQSRQMTPMYVYCDWP